MRNEMNDVTKKSDSELLFSKQDLIRLLWPLVVEQLLTVLVGMVDVLMVAYVGEATVSGVSLVDSVNYRDWRTCLWRYGIKMCCGCGTPCLLTGCSVSLYTAIPSERETLLTTDCIHVP